MRKLVLVLGLVCLWATGALAQGKVDNGWACGKPAMANSIEVGDQPNHAYAPSPEPPLSRPSESALSESAESGGVPLDFQPFP